MTPANDNEPSIGIDPLLRLRDVRTATALGTSTIYRHMAGGTFPRPVRLGPGTVRWRASAVREWIERLESAA